MDAGSTLDIWTEPLTSIAYLSVTMHYIDANFKHNARTLQVDQFPDVSHTAKAVLAEFKKCIIPFTGEFSNMNGPFKKQIRVTTDHASNNSGQDGLPSEFDWIGCADHSISTCVSFILDKRTKIVNGKRSKPFYQFYEEAPAVFDLLENCKELITYVKRVGLNKHLTPKLQQGCPTRWNSILIMTNSIACEFNRHYETLASRDKAHKMDCINQPLLDELVRFLNVFQIATKELEAYKAPTLHLVAHWRKVMLEHCDNVDEERVVKGRDNIEVTLPPDSEAIKRIKELIQGQITQKFRLTALHAAAAYLDPRQSSNIGDLEVNEELLAEAIAVVKSTMIRNGPPTPTVTVGESAWPQPPHAMPAGQALSSHHGH
ncbi:hAT family C-terminal dimerization region [Fragilaria crotonensis]|nr:hAT family C-terminal dimerization region [Fragilaria crotonensis]